MIGRVIVVSPENHEDLLIFQVPFNSAAHRLLISMLEETGHEYALLEAKPVKRGKSKPSDVVDLASNHIRSGNTLANPCDECYGGCMCPDGSYMCELQNANRKDPL